MTTLTIPAGPLQLATVRFVADSALAFCTEVRTHADGRIEVAQSWPSLSSGEAILWRLLESLTGGVLFEAFDGLDAVNLAAVAAAVGSAAGVAA